MKKLIVIVLTVVAFALNAKATSGCLSNVFFTPIGGTNACWTTCGDMRTSSGGAMAMLTNAYPLNIQTSCNVSNVCTDQYVAMDFFRIPFTVDCGSPGCCAGTKPFGILSWDGPGGHHTQQVDIPPNVCSGFVVFHAPTCSTDCAEQNPTACVLPLTTCSTQGGGDPD